MTKKIPEEFTDEPLPRSLKKGLSRLDFMKQVNLCRDKPWLEKKTEALQELIELAQSIDALEETIENTNLIFDLLYDFTYVTEEEYWKCLNEIAVKIKDEWGLTPDDTLIVAADYTEEADSSQKIVQDIKNRFTTSSSEKRWQSENFLSSLRLVPAVLGTKKNLVLLDDFNGTGTKITDTLQKLHTELQRAGLSPHIRVCSIASMEASKQKVATAMPLEDYFATKWLQKGISDRYSGEELELAKKCMLRLEAQLKNGFKSFGWGKAEALYGSESNAPNSVFPIFWWQDLKTKKRKATLLHRL